MKAGRIFIVFFMSAVVSGCYTATIDTGRTPSNVTINNNWAASWIYGLVPPKTVEAAAKCSQGVAKVKTQLSFANQLVGALTLGIYTPMSIQVTCARSSETSFIAPKEIFVISKNAPSENFQNVFMTAAEKAAKTEGEIFVRILNSEPNFDK